MQPPHRRPERAGAIARGDDGSAAVLQAFYPFGWPVQLPQPPHPRPERSGSIAAGSEAPLVPPFLRYGWEVQAPQPPHPRPERSGALARGDGGDEARLIPPPLTVAMGWQPELPMLQRKWWTHGAAFMFGDDGIEQRMFVQILYARSILAWPQALTAVGGASAVTVTAAPSAVTEVAAPSAQTEIGAPSAKSVVKSDPYKR